MGTECNAEQLEFGGLGRRRVVGAFDGEELSSDGGALALRELEDRAGILKRLAGCFTDHRAAGRVEHDVETLVKQRVMGICLGYEDLNDHDELRRDRLMALLCECADVTGAGRRRAADRGRPLAGKSTLNRLELSVLEAAARHRYKKVVADTAAMDALLLELFVEAHETPPAEIVLDIDATDDPLHGNQEGRFFHGHYDSYCYLPLYVFCRETLATPGRSMGTGVRPPRAMGCGRHDPRRVRRTTTRVWAAPVCGPAAGCRRAVRQAGAQLTAMVPSGRASR